MQIKINEKTFNLLSASGGMEMLRDFRRDVITMMIESTYDEISVLFVDGATFTIIEDYGEGQVSEFEYTDHGVAGPITDNRNGTVVVKMGKNNTEEQDLKEEIQKSKSSITAIVGSFVNSSDDITMVRHAVESGASLLTDEEAAKIPSMSKSWEVGEKVEPGDRRYYEPTGRLYKVREGQGHTTQADWTPDKTPALWAVVDVGHSGNQDDPILAARGMDYIYGKYYKDPEDNKIYICKRIGESDGGVINLQYLPHELIGQYFELIS